MEFIKRSVRQLPGFLTVKALRDVGRGGDQRHSALLWLRRPRGLFQPYGDTQEDRYPDVFAFVAQHLAGRDASILSVGCSTGEEVFSLKRYCPNARVKGLDISPHRIDICTRQAAEFRVADVSFIVAGDAEMEPANHYDAIFAMAVYRHGGLSDGPPRCGHLLSFSMFERAVSGLSRSLRPGGLLAIRHANFRFADTAPAADFDAVLEARAISPLYDSHNRRLPEAATEACVFLKKAVI
jgi:SAM-dependent methyltransferase